MAGLRKFHQAETARQTPSAGIQHGGFKEIYTKVLDDLTKKKTSHLHCRDPKINCAAISFHYTDLHIYR